MLTAKYAKPAATPPTIVEDRPASQPVDVCSEKTPTAAREASDSAPMLKST